MLVDRLTEKQVLELHALYQGEWWSKGRKIEDVRFMLSQTPLLFGLTEPGSERLVAFARVLSDFVYKALVFDVIVAPSARGRGLGHQILDAIVRHPRLQSVASIELYCRPELVPFYEQWGFAELPPDIRFMRRGLKFPTNAVV